MQIKITINHIAATLLTILTVSAIAWFTYWLNEKTIEYFIWFESIWELLSFYFPQSRMEYFLNIVIIPVVIIVHAMVWLFLRAALYEIFEND